MTVAGFKPMISRTKFLAHKLLEVIGTCNFRILLQVFSKTSLNFVSEISTTKCDAICVWIAKVLSHIPFDVTMSCNFRRLQMFAMTNLNFLIEISTTKCVTICVGVAKLLYNKLQEYAVFGNFRRFFKCFQKI